MAVKRERAAARGNTDPAPRGRRDRHPATEFDPIVHERVRLAIVSALAVHPVLSFAELKSLLELTDGNLSVHARKLEDAGYVACAKSFAGRVPRTAYRLTATGRRALDRYLGHMEALIRATKQRRG
jgi:DNA-binding transcriptional ArsR family regulator